MKAKKTLSLILACLMFSSFAAACNGTGGGGGYTGTGYGGGGSGSSNGSWTGGGSSSGGTTGGNLGDYEVNGNVSAGGSSGGNLGGYEGPSSGAQGGVGGGDLGGYEGTPSGGSTGGPSGSLGDYEIGGTGGTGNSGPNGSLGDYEGGAPSGGASGSLDNYEGAGDGGASGVGGGKVDGTAGNLGDYESGTDTSYQGATVLADKTWRNQQGYNNFYYAQLGDDVMPIGGWCAPPPAAKVTYPNLDGTTNKTEINYTTNQITLANYQDVANSGINAIYGLYDGLHSATSSRVNVMAALDHCETINAAYRAKQTNLPEEERKGKLVYLVKDSSAIGTIGFDGAQAMTDLYYEYLSHPACGGTLFKDEPGYDLFDDIGDATKKWKSHDLFGETKLALVNNLPCYASASQLYWDAISSAAAPYDYKANYDQWLDLYMEMVEPQVFSFDYYPYNFGGNAVGTDYYKSLSMVRNSTMKYNVPFWTFCQVGHWSVKNNDYSRAEMAFQVSASLAYGAKGIQWFNYWHALEMNPNATCGLIKPAGGHSKYYDMVQSFNAHIAAVDHVLMKSRHDGVVQIGSSPAAIPAGDKLQGHGYLSTKPTATGDTLIGCFTYRDKGYAYYVMANNTGAGTTVTLNLNGTYNTETILGTNAPVKGNQNKVQVTVPAGEGALVVVYNK